jgi:hypothetical protein
MAPSSKPLAPGSKKQGRFEVSTEELPAESVRMQSAPGTPQQRPLLAADSMESVRDRGEPVMRTLSMVSLEGSEGSGSAAQPQAQAKRKGRFNIVAEEASEGTKGRVGRSASVAALGDGKHSAQAATVLLPVLRDCLEGMTAQQEMMKQLVSALGEVERGKQAGLAAFLNEYGARIAGRPSKEDHARVKAELAQAKEDNSRLRDRLRQSEEQGAPRRPPPREGEGPASPPTEML